jgi:hypothetical protein
MTTDADRLFDLDEALGRIGRLAHQAWDRGSPSADEVIEEVLLTCDALMNGITDETLRGEIEATLPATWCPDLPFQQRLRNLIEARRTWTDCQAAQQNRIEELEAMTTTFGDPPLVVDPRAVAQLRLLLQGNPRALVLSGRLVELLKGVFGLTHGPTVIEPAIVCPRCQGECTVSAGAGPVPCLRCDGEGKVPDVEGMRLRLAELEYERSWLREIADAVNAMMAFMPHPSATPPADLWQTLELALADHRNAGYENSDHPDDFTAPGEPNDD